MQRETLEIRLSTEELWIELSGAAPPAALTQSLGRIRSKLAEEYRQANAELAEQRKELEEIRTQMTLQFEKLNERKQQFDRWVADRREELQQQASRLVAREQQIRHEERQSLSSVGYASA
jgi:DNA gyrase/topoisomerase IV subunit A